MKSKLESKMELILKSIGIDYVQEYKFHPTRKWRFDFAIPEKKIAIECEGGTYARGKTGHTSGAGYGRNIEKYNEAAIAGWCVLRFDTKMISSGSCIEVIEKALQK